jgi:hypothetical protein
MYCVQAAQQSPRRQRGSTIEEFRLERDLIEAGELAPSASNRTRPSRQYGSDDFHPSECARRQLIISMFPKKSSECLGLGLALHKFH